MVEMGVKVVELSPEQRGVFESKTSSVHSWFRSKYPGKGAEMLDTINKAKAEYRKK